MESTETITSLDSLPKISVATATEQDLQQLGVMGHLFAQEYGAGLMNFDTKIFLQTMKEYMAKRLGIVLCSHNEDFELTGAIAAALYPNVFDGALCASELFWYVWPGAAKGTGACLLDGFEEWARVRGATRITMAFMLHNMPERLAAFYERRGYRAFETHYVKAI
jgi:GNAT superfamily N-acetyltransferase